MSPHQKKAVQAWSSPRSSKEDGKCQTTLWWLTQKLSPVGVVRNPIPPSLDATVLKGLLANTHHLCYFSDCRCTEDSPVDLSQETLRGRRGFLYGLSPSKPKKLRHILSRACTLGYASTRGPKTNSISGTIRLEKHSQPGTAKQVCRCRIGQPNTSCQNAWSMHL